MKSYQLSNVNSSIIEYNINSQQYTNSTHGIYIIKQKSGKKNLFVKEYFNLNNETVNFIYFLFECTVQYSTSVQSVHTDLTIFALKSVGKSHSNQRQLLILI